MRESTVYYRVLPSLFLVTCHSYSYIFKCNNITVQLAEIWVKQILRLHAQLTVAQKTVPMFGCFAKIDAA